MIVLAARHSSKIRRYAHVVSVVSRRFLCQPGSPRGHWCFWLRSKGITLPKASSLHHCLTWIERKKEILQCHCVPYWIFTHSPGSRRFSPETLERLFFFCQEIIQEVIKSVMSSFQKRSLMKSFKSWMRSTKTVNKQLEEPEIQTWLWTFSDVLAF